jgi:hypothetical protein
MLANFTLPKQTTTVETYARLGLGMKVNVDHISG